MTGLLNKDCTGYRCEKKERCRLFVRQSPNPFNYISPLAMYDECPYYAPRTESEDDDAND